MINHLPRVSAWHVFLITFAVYAVLVLAFSSPPGISQTNGDEPHYLLQMHSLVYDGDLEVTNNYANRDFRDFYPAETLDIGAYLYRYNDQVVRHHFALGMPLLLAPAYAVGARSGVLLALALLTAIGMGRLYVAARQLASPPIAFFGVLLCALLYPIVIYSHQIYPEAVIMALTAYTLSLIVSDADRHLRVRALLVGLFVGLMPQFQNKYILLAAVLYLVFLWRTRAALGQMLRWSLPPLLLLAVGHLAWAYIVYGEIGPSALISPGYQRITDERIDDGVLGLWFDQEIGLFFFAPLYLMALPGAWVLISRRATRRIALALLLIYASFHLLSGVYYDWPAGLSPAPRYLIPVLPVLVIFVCAALEWLLRRGQLIQPLVLVLLTAYITYLILFVQRAFMFPFYVGTNMILRDHFPGNGAALWLMASLPSFLRAFESAYPKLLTTAAIVTLLLLAAIPVNRVVGRVIGWRRS